MSVQLALSQRRDLGEAVVVGHAKILADAGHTVFVVIDDRGGQVLASNEGLQVLTVEDLLLAAVQLDLLHADKLQATYESLLPFGSGLPLDRQRATAEIPTMAPVRQVTATLGSAVHSNAATPEASVHQTQYEWRAGRRSGAVRTSLPGRTASPRLSRHEHVDEE